MWYSSVATLFWDSCGVILIDYLERGQTINADRYCATLTRLREEIRRKQPGMLSEGVILLRNNGKSHIVKQRRNCCDDSGGKSGVTSSHTAQIWHPVIISCFRG
ncbi:hypothetical protein CDAR_502061 [Caerostris darwini]|uniref:Mariner Mos1 transposase n=1 Tax=Caerostris darwini TaxID=1538125 RepID=A0AAV4VVF3_9ARAC|nr:hypothetical protein CDAR_502061 [Caerostris darwini]